MKTLRPPWLSHNSFVATHALGHMMCGYSLLVPMKQRVLNKLSKEPNYVYFASVRFEQSVCLCIKQFVIPHGLWTAYSCRKIRNNQFVY